MNESRAAARRSLHALLILALGTSLGCVDEFDFDVDNPSEPGEAYLYDLVDGPIDRPSGFDVVEGRELGRPRAVRVDQTGEWDGVFAVLDGEPVWLPRGYFEALEASSSIAVLDRSFAEVEEVPGDASVYEDTDPIPITPGTVYAFRSRLDPDESLPCRVYAKVEVVSVEGDPARARIRFVWNPNCDRRDVRLQGDR